MVGVVLAAHGEVAQALLKAAEAIVGPLPAVEAISLGCGAGPDTLRNRLVDAVRQIDDGSGVIVLCDMYGGTPANVCLSTQCGTPVEVVTGVNLPMVVKLATARTAGTPVREAAAQLAVYGQKHITHASEILRRRRQEVEAEHEEASSRAPANGACSEGTSTSIAAAPPR